MKQKVDKEGCYNLLLFRFLHFLARLVPLPTPLTTNFASNLSVYIHNFAKNQ